MESKNNWMELTGKVVYALLAALSSALCIMGYFPLVPAFYAVCCMNQRKNVLMYIGLFAGMGFCMPVGSTVKYLFVLLVLGIGIRFYIWANRRCSGWVAGVIAGIAAAGMNCSGIALTKLEKTEFVMGICEGAIVFGATVILHYVLHMVSEYGKTLFPETGKWELPVPESVAMQDTSGRIHAFAEAVDELSVAFAAMGSRSQMTEYESVTVLEREIMDRHCASCDVCALYQGQEKLSVRIRRMLQAVVAHHPKEEILSRNYMEECPRYSEMVEEAVAAFSRMELNEAWYKRLRENRLVIAQQLDAMADAMQDWTKGKKSLDKELRTTIARIAFEARERGLVAYDVHIYEDEYRRRCVSAMVASKWGGGIPSKNYCKAVERAMGMAMRLQKDARSILTVDAVPVTAYEDTCFYALSGVAAEPRDGMRVNGDNFALFTKEDGRYHICLSDGMGSGPSASKESDMVVDLMQKFIEAGFPRDTAIRIMNSAMVLKGEDESYSTLDFAELDLYTGNLEMTKIGAAASFLKHKQEVTCLSCASLPAGVDASYEGEPLHAKMTNGDFLVMVTDGVLEYLHVKNPESRLSEMISEIKTDNAGAFANTLLEHVMLFTGGHALDDMTIVVTGIWEK